MLMVIFGAGASYDSAEAFRLPRADGGPWRPPLATDLFKDPFHVLGDLVERYPKLTHVLPYLRSPSNGRSVEQVLESFQDQGRENPETARELASVRFYLCDLLQTITREWAKRTNGVTNYSPLIREILRLNRPGEEVLLVTFNYDLLLDHALHTFDFKGRDPDTFLDSHPVLKLFKLHGSIDWSRLVAGQTVRLQPQHLIEQADTLVLTDNFVRAVATDPYQMHNFPAPIVPAIAIPVQTKTEQHFECPPSHREYLAARLPRVTKILIIGWQAKEAHFLNMLRSNRPALRQLMVVGANAADSEDVLGYFSSEIGLFAAQPSFAQSGFTNFVINQEGEKFFRAS